MTSSVAIAAYDAPAPLVTAVARAADVALPAPITTTGTLTTAATVATAPPPPAPPPVEMAAAPAPAGAKAAAAPAKPAPAVTVPNAPVAPLPVPATAPPPAPPPAPPAQAATPEGVLPYLGLGTWVDVYDWSTTYTNGRPTVVPADVDRMADAGVQTLYIQASKHDAPTDVLEPELLQAHIERARARRMRVVVWYLPTLVDTGRDLQRLKAIAGLRHIDGLAVDIEARNVADVNERNRRLIELSAALRAALPGRTIAGIVLPPVVLEVINPKFWPAFPYRQIAPHYDLWMTMGYWTNRTQASGYRDAYRYTKENVDRLRNNLGQPQAPVHPIGGIGNRTTAADIEGYKQAVTAVSGIGGSIYDWHTTAAAHWGRLRHMRLR